MKKHLSKFIIKKIEIECDIKIKKVEYKYTDYYDTEYFILHIEDFKITYPIPMTSEYYKILLWDININKQKK
jgi:hypothetical protein